MQLCGAGDVGVETKLNLQQKRLKEVPPREQTKKVKSLNKETMLSESTEKKRGAPGRVS